MIVKSKKFFLISSLCIGCFLLGNVFILTSCYTNSNSTVGSPENNKPSTPSQPINPTPPPSTQPSKPTNPTEPILPIVPPTPPVTQPEQTSTINSSSLSIKGDKTHILPSMLLTTDKKNIDISKFNKNYTTDDIISESFKLIELDDTDGSISFEMNYQNKNTKKQEVFLFNFTGLMKISTELKINFKQETNSFLNAYEYSEKNNNSLNFNKFNELINELSKEKENKFLLLNGDNEIPLSYLKVNSVTVTDWKNTWFTSSNNLDLTYTLKNPRVTFYKKNVNDNSPIENEKYFLTNVSKEFIVKFYSAADYVLNKISVNDKYHETKTSDYYWGDCQFNNGTETSLNLSDAKWLKDYNTTLDGTNTKYKVILADSGANCVEIDQNKNLNLNVKVKVESETNSQTHSSSTKKLTISNITKIDNDPFSYNENDNINKFMFKQNVSNLEKNLNNIKSDKESIISYINDKSGQINITSLLVKSKAKIQASLVSNMEILFNNETLVNKTTKNRYYSNDYIFVENINYNQNDFQYFYNKEQDVFQVKIKPSVSLSSTYTSSNYITVNFTKPHASLVNLKK